MIFHFNHAEIRHVIESSPDLMIGTPLVLSKFLMTLNNMVIIKTIIVSPEFV